MPRPRARATDVAPPGQLIAELVSLLDGAPSIDDPADLEPLATTFLVAPERAHRGSREASSKKPARKAQRPRRRGRRG